MKTAISLQFFSRESITRITGMLCFFVELLIPSYVLGETEREAILNHKHTSTWAYYTEPNQNPAPLRWYISQLGYGGSKVGIYSLGPITNGNTSWWTVGNGAASIQLTNDGNGKITANYNLDNTTSNTFIDIASNSSVTNSLIHSDRQKIQGQIVPIKWYFFRAPNGSWYIVNAPNYFSGQQILRFSQDNGQYAWKATDTADLIPTFSVDSSGYELISFTSDKVKRAMFLASQTDVGKEIAPYVTDLYSKKRIYVQNLDPSIGGSTDMGGIFQYTVTNTTLTCAWNPSDIYLNVNNSDDVLASILVHEGTHYKDAVVNSNNQTRLLWGDTELRAHANQYRYFKESNLTSTSTYTNLDYRRRNAIEKSYDYVYSNGSKSAALDALYQKSDISYSPERMSKYFYWTCTGSF